MVVDYEPTFPDVCVASCKFRSIIEDDDELNKVFPEGIKHLQVSEWRGAKNLKEILAPSAFVPYSPEENEMLVITRSMTIKNHLKQLRRG